MVEDAHVVVGREAECLALRERLQGIRLLQAKQVVGSIEESGIRGRGEAYVPVLPQQGVGFLLGAGRGALQRKRLASLPVLGQFVACDVQGRGAPEALGQRHRGLLAALVTQPQVVATLGLGKGRKEENGDEEKFVSIVHGDSSGSR